MCFLLPYRRLYADALRFNLGGFLYQLRSCYFNLPHLPKTSFNLLGILLFVLFCFVFVRDLSYSCCLIMMRVKLEIYKKKNSHSLTYGQHIQHAHILVVLVFIRPRKKSQTNKQRRKNAEKINF